MFIKAIDAECGTGMAEVEQRHIELAKHQADVTSTGANRDNLRQLQARAQQTMTYSSRDTQNVVMAQAGAN